MSTYKPGRKVYRIQNYLLCNARRNCKFIFGDFYISCDTNYAELCFEIKLRKYINVKDEKGNIIRESIEDYVDIKAFKKFWGEQWKIMFDTFEEVK